MAFPAVDQAWVAPNPAQGASARARFHLLADARDVRLCVYSQALVRVEQRDLGPRPGGWNEAGLPLTGLAPQLYYLVLRVHQGPDDVPSKPFSFYRLP